MERTLIELVRMLVEEKKDVFQLVSRRVGRRKESIVLLQDQQGLIVFVRVEILQRERIAPECLELQRYIKEQVELLTGIHVSMVDIQVEGIREVDKREMS